MVVPNCIHDWFESFFILNFILNLRRQWCRYTKYWNKLLVIRPWFRHFKNYTTSIENDKCSGHLSTGITDANVTAILERFMKIVSKQFITLRFGSEFCRKNLECATTGIVPRLLVINKKEYWVMCTGNS